MFGGRATSSSPSGVSTFLSAPPLRRIASAPFDALTPSLSFTKISSGT